MFREKSKQKCSHFAYIKIRMSDKSANVAIICLFLYKCVENQFAFE